MSESQRGGPVGPAARDADLPPSGGSWPRKPTRSPASTPRRKPTGSASGRRRPAGSTWAEPWSEVLDWDLPFAKWFVGGKLNVAVNCVDRHVDAGLGDRVAFHWEGEPGDTRTITYARPAGRRCARPPTP